jgi:uncharacterized protein YqeY
MSVYDRLNEEIKISMKNKDTDRLGVLRMLKSKIMQVDTKGGLEDSAMIKLINSYAKNIKETIEQSQKLGKSDHLEAAEKELVIVQEFLPKVLNAEETTALVASLIKSLGLTNRKEMGKIMKEIQASGKAVDGPLVKSAVDALLPA